uniref:Retrotransposon protein, putative, unclassified n=1 Tax=Oryza sativa subsp. japonica TaxID=39947 RepID=Q10A75_ORYSJ|nr:retrotransposon protein, putative, unclassified [Oryza sativa Japonica Group]
MEPTLPWSAKLCPALSSMMYPNVEEYEGQIELSPPAAYLTFHGAHNKRRGTVSGGKMGGSRQRAASAAPTAAFCAMDKAEVAQFLVGPKDAVFEKPDESNRHMKPLYLKDHIDGKPVSRMLVDGGAAVNLMPYSLFKKLGHGDDELKKTNMILNGFNGEPTEAKGIFLMELTV